jgi:hypothetical protein
MADRERVSLFRPPKIRDKSDDEGTISKNATPRSFLPLTTDTDNSLTR